MTHQEIIERFAQLRDKALPLCECGGTGEVTNRPDFVAGALKPLPHHCPKCTELRGLDLRDMAEIYSWPSMSDRSLASEPYKIDREPQGKLWVVHVMQVLGEWEKFVWELNQMILKEVFPRASKEGGNCYTVPHVLALCTDGEHLVPAIGSYLEERADTDE